MNDKWKVDLSASFGRQLGKSAHELSSGPSVGNQSCPGLWEMSNGDIAIIGRDVTAAYTAGTGRLPEGASIDPGESLIIVPREMMVSAKVDIPDA